MWSANKSAERAANYLGQDTLGGPYLFSALIGNQPG
jgi:hypothetical protein